jgi:IMP dehydrogenase
LQGHKIELPVINDNNELVGLITFRDITKLTQNQMPIKINWSFASSSRLGVTADAWLKERPLLMQRRCIIDTAHGHTCGVVDDLKKWFQIPTRCYRRKLATRSRLYL